MTDGPTNYFLLIYDLATREVKIEEWGADVEGATAAYTEREHQYEGSETVEVVLVGADSIETIQITHSHYFVKATGDLIEQLARELLSS